MWIVGHTALSYLVVRCGFSIASKRPGPSLILMVFIFGNIIDALHFGWLRDLTHNPFGTVVFALVWVLIFQRLGLLKGMDIPILLGVSVVHAAGDLIFGGYLPFFPFSGAVYWYRPWNSIEDLLVESLLAVIFIVVLIVSGDFSELKGFATKERKKFFVLFSWKRPLRTGLLYSYLFIAFYLLVIGQFVYYLIWKQLGSLLALDIYFDTFMAAFVLFIGVISLMAVGTGKTDVREQ